MSKNMKKMISRMVSHRSFPYVMAFLMPFIICASVYDRSYLSDLAL